MNTDDAAKLLRSRGWIVTKVLRGGWAVAILCSPIREHYHDHELIKLAMNNLTTHYPTADLKEHTHRRNRAATKQSLVHERFDEFQQNKLRATGNPRDWD